MELKVKVHGTDGRASVNWGRVKPKNGMGIWKCCGQLAQCKIQELKGNRSIKEK